MTSISLQLPPPIQSGFYGLPSWTEASVFTPPALSYLKMVPPALTQCEPKPTVTPPTLIKQEVPSPVVAVPVVSPAIEVLALLEKYNQLAVQEACLLQNLRCENGFSPTLDSPPKGIVPTFLPEGT